MVTGDLHSCRAATRIPGEEKSACCLNYFSTFEGEYALESSASCAGDWRHLQGFRLALLLDASRFSRKMREVMQQSSTASSYPYKHVNKELRGKSQKPHSLDSREEGD
jgi:hypothetical protein